MKSISPLRSILVCIAFLAMASSLNAQTVAPAPEKAPAADQAAIPPEVASALQMPESPDRKKAVVAAAQTWAKSAPIPFLTWAFSLDPKHGAEVFPAISSAAEGPDPKAAADFIVQHVDGTPNMPLLHGYMLGWSKKDMAAAQAYSLQPSLPRDSRYLAIFTVADMLVRKDATAKSAVAWTLSIPAGDNRLAAIDGTVCIWVRVDVPAAAAWIKTLSPDEMKWGAYILANNFRASKDGKAPATLPDAVALIPLSDTDREAVIKGPRPDSYHFTKSQAALTTAAK